MGFDGSLKRYFPLVVCLLIAVAAYFQAAGMGQIFASAAALDPSSVPAKAPMPRAAPPPAAGHEHETNAQAILDRNPFDSATGPLTGEEIKPEIKPQSVAEIDRDPYDDPDCDTAKVMMIVASDDPDWSFASIAGPDGKTMLRRRGDEINGQTIVYIGDQRNDERKRTDERKIWDRVWLTSGGSRCQLQVGGKAPAKGASTPATPAAPTGKGSSTLPSEITSKIRKVGEHEYDLDRSALDYVLANQGELMKVRIVPEKEGDKVAGLRMFGIRQGSLFSLIGMENGDRLNSINGFEMSDPQKALEAYAKLQRADHLTVSIQRSGKPVNIDFNIK
ncbi:MAG: type II secretion system protein GspC [Byssovorax sp.]